MKNSILFLLCLLFPLLLSAQASEQVNRLLEEGVQLHDEGELEKALEKYDSALAIEPNHLSGMAEKAMTLLQLGRAEECIELCDKAVDKHPKSEQLKLVFATWGNALDMQDKPEKSLKVYDKGIKQFPDFYLLHFNKGITLVGLEKYEEAMASFQQSVRSNPDHASSHNAIGRIAQGMGKKIPALLAFSRFLVLEPEGQRASENLEHLKKILAGDAKKTGANNTTIELDASMLEQKGEDNFSSIELMLSLLGAANMDKDGQKLTETERFIFQIETLCALIKENSKDNNGFFWEYYAPYLADLKTQGHVETFAYIALISTGEDDLVTWIKGHPSEIDTFYYWSENFAWKSK